MRISEDITFDSFEINNKEFYSSNLKDFEVNHQLWNVKLIVL